MRYVHRLASTQEDATAGAERAGVVIAVGAVLNTKCYLTRQRPIATRAPETKNPPKRVLITVQRGLEITKQHRL